MMTFTSTSACSSTLSLEDLRYWLAANRTFGFGGAKLKNLLPAAIDLPSLFTADAKALLHLGIPTTLLQTNWKLVDEDLQWLNDSDQHIIAFPDPSYPPLLKEINSPPLVLFVKGNKELLASPQLAIVGSRNPSPSGKNIANHFASALAYQQLTITSGLALGIDAAAHQGALAVQGKSIAVFGTSINQIYPNRHALLAEQIVAMGGALVSEFPLHTPLKPDHFPQRNRIISGLSLGTLVVEATLRSGSLITARLANEQGREVFAIPGSIHNPLARGCHSLIKQGAKLAESIEDILEELKSIFPAAFCQQKVPPNVPISSLQQKINPAPSDPSQQKILACIGHETTPMDILITRSGMNPNLVASVLFMLELDGYIIQTIDGYTRA